MARSLALLLLIFAAFALIAVACGDDGDFLFDDEELEATGTPPIFQRTPQPTPSPTATPIAAPGVCGVTYTVQAGDNPSTIAENCGVDVDDLLELNGIDDPRSLTVGQELKLPPQSTEGEE